MNVLPRDKRVLILKLICRHSGVNDIADITGCSTNTVRFHLMRMGEACASLHDRLVRGVRPERVELDELWSYIYTKRERNLQKRDRATHLGPRRRQPPAERGQRYTWIGFDPDSKAVLSYHTGDRGESAAAAFVTDLSSRVVNRPMLCTDAHTVYPFAIQRAFGSNVDHVVMQKQMKSWFDPQTGERGTRMVGLQRVAQNQSTIDVSRASTSHVERMNANIRNYNARFTRQTYRFSKKLENHTAQLAISIMYHNFVRPNHGFNGTEDKHCSPAMKAGLTTETWAYERLLDEIDAYWRNKTVIRTPASSAGLPVYEPIPPDRWTDQPYLVSHSRLKNYAKVHAAHCRDCRRASKGRKGSKAHAWYAFASQAEALKCAGSLAPLDFSVCSLCVLHRYPGNVAGAQKGRLRRKFE